MSSRFCTIRRWIQLGRGVHATIGIHFGIEIVVGGASSWMSKFFRSARCRRPSSSADRLTCEPGSAEVAANTPLQQTKPRSILSALRYLACGFAAERQVVRPRLSIDDKSVEVCARRVSKCGTVESRCGSVREGRVRLSARALGNRDRDRFLRLSATRLRRSSGAPSRATEITIDSSG